jgi:glutamine phosphoribosylpyrophosphate amidotransferase
MVGYVGTSETDLQNLFAAFRQGSGCDPYLKKAGIDHECHKDGWGYVILHEKGLHYYRSSNAVFEDDAPLPKLSGKIYAILHSRLGSDQSLNGHICAHPFMAATDQAVIYFAHNGGVDAENLPPRVVDSEWAFAQIIKAGSVEKVLPFLMDKTKQNAALNLLILTVPRDNTQPPVIQYLNYYKTNAEGRVGYYQMFCGDMPHGKAIFSSTINDIPVKTATNVKKAVTGKLFVL